MSITKIITKSHDEWLVERNKSLGGSDMGSVLGLNEYSSPYTVWAEKTGRLPMKEETEFMRFGNDMEGYVARRFTDKSGLKVINDKATWRNSEYPHLHANIDRRVVGQRAGLECKITSALNEKKYRNGKFPDRFYAQCVEYLAVTEFDRWYLAVYVYGKGLFVYQMTRIPDDTVPEWCEASVYVDDGEIKALVEYADSFWVNYVEKDTPPPADGTKSTEGTISTLYPNSTDETVSLMAYERELAEYMAVSAQITVLEERKKEAANKVKAFMNEAGKGESSSYKVSWATGTKHTFDSKRFAAENPGINLDKYYKTSTYRTFKVTEKGE